jgi:hypothetical protein
MEFLPTELNPEVLEKAGFIILPLDQLSELE